MYDGEYLNILYCSVYTLHCHLMYSFKCEVLNVLLVALVVTYWKYCVTACSPYSSYFTKYNLSPPPSLSPNHQKQITSIHTVQQCGLPSDSKLVLTNVVMKILLLSTLGLRTSIEQNYTILKL